MQYQLLCCSCELSDVYIALLNLDVCRYCRFHSLVIDVTMALDTLSLPVLEPLTPTRLQDVTVLALSCLYAGEWIFYIFFGALSHSRFCSAWLPALLRLSPQVTFISHEFGRYAEYCMVW